MTSLELTSMRRERMDIIERNRRAQAYLDRVAFRHHENLMKRIDFSLSVVFGLSLVFFVLSVVLHVF